MKFDGTSNRIRMNYNWRTIILVSLITLIFCFQQASQLAVTPIGEGMDFYGHWSYIMFFQHQGRWPSPGELAVPRSVVELQERMPAPDNTSGGKYHQWAGMTPAQREAIKRQLQYHDKDTQYVSANYEAQQPPLYYWLASMIYSPIKNIPLNLQRYILAIVSIIVAALAFPAIYSIFRTLLTRSQSLMLLLTIAWFPNLMPFLGRVTNDSLAFTLITYAVWTCTRQPQRMRYTVLTGILLVLCFFTKTYALAIAPAFVLISALDFRGKRFPLLRWKNLAVIIIILSFGALALFFLNYIITGHIILLTEAMETAAVPLLQKITAVFSISPVWFFGGLTRGFLWCGYWSFVSPRLLHLFPLILPVLLAAYRPIAMIRQGTFLCLDKLWGHYAIIIFFVFGMLWHATMFSLHAGLVKETIYSGNEGWYMNVLIPSVFLCIFFPAKTRLKTHGNLYNHFLVVIVFLTMLWNVVARMVMYNYWSGQMTIAQKFGSQYWIELLDGFFHKQSYRAWLSLPGIIHPVFLTSVIFFLVALVLSYVLIAFISGERRRKAKLGAPLF